MSNDEQLQRDVVAELEWEPSVTAAHIGVVADGGIVTLTGHVASFAEKHAAEAAALRVKNVRAVADEIEVSPPMDARRSDDRIAREAIASLAANVSVPPNSIKVTVADGWITLTGEVGWHFQKAAAASDVRRLFGVVGLVDETTIKPTVDTSNLSDEITHALHRSWFFDPKTVFVTAEGGKVRLTGTVYSQHDRQLAAATAWAASGTTDVDNQIAVG